MIRACNTVELTSAPSGIRVGRLRSRALRRRLSSRTRGARADRRSPLCSSPARFFSPRGGSAPHRPRDRGHPRAGAPSDLPCPRNRRPRPAWHGRPTLRASGPGQLRCTSHDHGRGPTTSHIGHYGVQLRVKWETGPSGNTMPAGALQPPPTRARGPRLAVALAALPAARIGKSPGLVGTKPLVVRDDLGSDLRDPDERAAQLSRRSARGHDRGADLFAARAGLGDLGEAELRGGIAFQPAPGEVDGWLEVVVGLVLAQRRGLDLVVDHSREQRAGVGPPGLEVEVAHDAPLEPGREGVFHLALDCYGLAEGRDQLAEGELDRVEAELECPVLAQVGLPGDPELLALGLGGSFPAVPERVLELVDGEALAVVEDVPVVERDCVVDLAPEEHRPARRGLLPEDVAPAPVLRAKDEAAVARVR